MELFKTPHIPFMRYKYIALAATGVIVLAGIINMTMFKGLKMGVDFGEGTLIRVMLKSRQPIGEVRQLLQRVGLGNSVIQESGKSGREFQIRTQQVVKVKAGDQEQMEAHEALANKVIDALRGNATKAELAQGLKDLNAIDEKSLAALLESSFPGSGPEAARDIVAQRNVRGIITDFSELQTLNLKPEMLTFLKGKTFLGPLTVLSRETVGPQVGADLRKKAVMATIWSLIAMLVYIALRFKLEYGVAAIFTLAQDVLITMAVYSFTNREINLTIIAGILTIVGYSINDTIVIFDRVRENQKALRKESLEHIMDLSLNQCLGRTLITSGTVFLTVGDLFLFGGEVINDFAFLMLVGTIEGVYSTIYQACPVVLIWQNIFKSKKGSRR
ncbi:MAG: protein translocase subunit SecF [Acidobacteriota bacterium]